MLFVSRVIISNGFASSSPGHIRVRNLCTSCHRYWVFSCLHVHTFQTAESPFHRPQSFAVANRLGDAHFRPGQTGANDVQTIHLCLDGNGPGFARLVETHFLIDGPLERFGHPEPTDPLAYPFANPVPALARRAVFISCVAETTGSDSVSVALRQFPALASPFFCRQWIPAHNQTLSRRGIIAYLHQIFLV